MEQDKTQNIKTDNDNQPSQSKWHTDRIMGIAAIFISVLSMIAMTYQSYLAREENELMRIQQSATVLPYLDYWSSNIEGEYKFIIENKGLGPAFIKEVKFVGIDVNKDTLFFESSHGLINFIEQQSTFLDSIDITRSAFHANMLLSPSEKRNFLTFSFDNSNQRNQIRKEYYKYYVGFKIVYEDVYGAAWVLDTEKDYPVKLKKE